jgi:hypothetical protein
MSFEFKILEIRICFGFRASIFGFNRGLVSTYTSYFKNLRYLI